MEHGWAGFGMLGAGVKYHYRARLVHKGSILHLGSLALNSPPNSISENIQFFGPSLWTFNFCDFAFRVFHGKAKEGRG
jgi:hypothetical protein